jgi:hypothetical protein
MHFNPSLSGCSSLYGVDVRADSRDSVDLRSRTSLYNFTAIKNNVLISVSSANAGGMGNITQAIGPQF